MSFANILSEPATNHPAPAVVSPLHSLHRKTSASQITSPINTALAKDIPGDNETPTSPILSAIDRVQDELVHTNGYVATVPKPRRALTVRENEKVSKALVEIDDAVFSDVDTTGFDEERKRYITKSRKRALDVEEVETTKRKVPNTRSEYRSRADKTFSVEELSF